MLCSFLCSKSSSKSGWGDRRRRHGGHSRCFEVSDGFSRSALGCLGGPFWRLPSGQLSVFLYSSDMINLCFRIGRSFFRNPRFILHSSKIFILLIAFFVHFHKAFLSLFYFIFFKCFEFVPVWWLLSFLCFMLDYGCRASTYLQGTKGAHSFRDSPEVLVGSNFKSEIIIILSCFILF